MFPSSVMRSGVTTKVALAMNVVTIEGFRHDRRTSRLLRDEMDVGECLVRPPNDYSGKLTASTDLCGFDCFGRCALAERRYSPSPFGGLY